MAERDSDGCYVARNALRLAEDLQVSLNALQRRASDIEFDKNRLGERVASNEAKIADHEAMTHKAVQQLNDTLGNLQELVAAAVSAPQVPTGVAVLESWRNTPTPAKLKLGGAVMAILAAAESFRPLVALVVSALKHAFHVP